MAIDLRNFKRRKVLVTGGLGFIGSNLCLRLVGLGAKVTVVDSLIPEYGGNLFNIKGFENKLRVDIADMRDEHSMNYLVRGMDYIFNLAGQISHIDSMVDPYTDLEINTRSQLSLLESCKKYNKKTKIIYAGTRQVYGKPDYLPVDEKHPVNPIDVNGINKFAGEYYHILYYRVYGIQSTALRLTNTYGPRQLVKHSRQGFMGWFVRKVLDDKQIQIYGDGRQKRDFNFVEDVVEALLMVALNRRANGMIYNLGGDRPLSLKKLVKLMIRLTGKGSYKLVPFPPGKKPIDIGSYYADSRKIRQEIGWRPKIGIEEGLRRTFEYYRKYKNHYWFDGKNG
ncbi:NAD-dependent epimerase/dehydratase family protein [Candidatus Omnitrophota bacterium]